MSEWQNEVNKAFAETMREVEGWIEKQGEDPRLFAPRAKLMQLLRLRTWSMRTRLSIGEILSILVPVLKQNRHDVRNPSKWRYKTSGRAIGGLGVSLHTLTSRSALKLLYSEILTMYPNHEEVALWREREKERQLRLEELEDTGEAPRRQRVKGMLNYETSTNWTHEYLKKIQQVQRRNERSENEAWRRRKNYRNNPWR